METSFAALILITLLIVAALTLGHAYLSSQEELMTSWQEMEERSWMRTRTGVELLDAGTFSGGSNVQLTVWNDGEIKLADYDQWDVVVQYYTSWITLPYRIEWLPYGAVIADDQWTVTGIYGDAAGTQAEVYEPGILNPGEGLRMWLRLAPPVGSGTTNLVTVSTRNGVTASTVFTR
jgi:hypothetical protein